MYNMYVWFELLYCRLQLLEIILLTKFSSLYMIEEYNFVKFKNKLKNFYVPLRLRYF